MMYYTKFKYYCKDIMKFLLKNIIDFGFEYLSFLKLFIVYITKIQIRLLLYLYDKIKKAWNNF